MVTILGSATAGYSYAAEVPDLPRPQAGITKAHSPWCVDCKRKGRTLDAEQRCENCARAAASRAAAAERRAAAEQASVAARTQQGRAVPAARAAQEAADAVTDLATEPAPSAEEGLPDQAAGKRAVAEQLAQERALEKQRRAVDRAAEKARAAEERAAERAAEKARIAQERVASREAAKAGRTAARRRPVRRTSSRTSPASGRSPGRGGPQRMVLPAEAIVAAYNSGQTLAQIAQAHGCSGPTIGRLLEERGIKRRGAPVPRDPELLEQIRRLYVDEALTQAEVAARIGYSTKIVQNVLGELGIEPRPSASERSKAGIGRPIKIPPAERPKIIDRYRNGESGSAIALTYGVAAASIYSLLRRAGVEERHGNRTLAGPGRNHAEPISVRLRDLGVTPAEVKAWALECGLVERVTRGLPTLAVVEAYAARR